MSIWHMRNGLAIIIKHCLIQYLLIVNILEYVATVI